MNIQKGRKETRKESKEIRKRTLSKIKEQSRPTTVFVRLEGEPPKQRFPSLKCVSKKITPQVEGKGMHK